MILVRVIPSGKLAWSGGDYQSQTQPGKDNPGPCEGRGSSNPRYTFVGSHFLRRRRLPPVKENPRVNAFCRIAPSVRRNIRPILRAGVVFASDLSCRTSPANQGTFFRRAAIVKPPYRLFATTRYACFLFIAIDDPNNVVTRAYLKNA
jgi:hypothetical protein